MEIHASDVAIAGKPFHFTVIGAVGQTQIACFVDGRQIFFSPCPDPPCHEEMFIPDFTAGSLLVVVAVDSANTRVTREFVIAS